MGEGVSVGLAGLPCGGRDGDGQAGGLSASEANVEVDLVGLVDGDVVDEQAGHAFAFPLRGGRVGPQGGEVGGEGPDATLVLFGERGPGGGGGALVVVVGCLELAQSVVPVGFEGVGHQPVVGVDGQVAASGRSARWRARSTWLLRRASASSARASSSAWTVRATSSASGVTVSSNSWPIAMSMVVPGTEAQGTTPSRMAARMQR